MILRVIRQFFTVSSRTTHFVAPAALITSKSEQLPRLQVNQSKQILTHGWAHKPFLVDRIMAQYTGQTIQLKNQIFNQPVRRDLIYRLYHWRINLNKIRTHHSRTQSETSGSGSKPRPQKGQGRARLGNLRAPGRKKGVKAHGAKPKIYTYHLNQKIKLKALKSLLSSKAAQGKIKIVENEQMVEGKTKILQKALKQHLPQNAVILFITSANVDPNFQKAQRNIPYVKWSTSENFDVLDLIKADRIILTRQGLEELTLNIFKSQYIIFRQPHMKKFEQRGERDDQVQEQYDPSKPLQFKFRILSDYLQLFEQTKLTKPQLLKKQFQRVQKITAK